LSGKEMSICEFFEVGFMAWIKSEMAVGFFKLD